MNKIAAYLNEHLQGEVSSSKSLRRAYSTDGSVLSIAPEIVAFPRVTNDVRKIARFTWQLAEKGHTVSMTVRGYGRDTTGAAIGKGIVIDTTKHLNSIIQVANKDRLVHLQPGVSLETLNSALKWQGLSISGAFLRDIKSLSVGGMIASDSLGLRNGIADNIKQLEVVLANGDVIETGRISKREVSKKLGLQTFEGEIYRKLSGLLEDNEQLIKELAADKTRDNTGYKRIASIRGKDGSFDLTPLFIGSQGTLGIITEVMLKTGFYSQNEIEAAVVTKSVKQARELAEKFIELDPSELAVYDGALLRRAAKQGSQFSALGSVEQVGAALYIRFDDPRERTQKKKYKKFRKILSKMNLGVIDSLERDPQEFAAITDIRQTLELGTSEETVAIPLIDGAYVPPEKRDDFEDELADLAKKHHMELPLLLNVLNGTYDIFPLLKLDTVSDKQKLFKLMGDYAALVTRCEGALTTDGAEGRLKANAAWAILDEQETQLYEGVRQIFDPFNTLNPGVKQKNDLRSLVGALRASYDSSSVL